MDRTTLVSALNEEIENLTQARDLLLRNFGEAISRKPGRPAKHVQKTEAANGRRGMSPTARRRISEMMKRRWAERRKQKSK